VTIIRLITLFCTLLFLFGCASTPKERALEGGIYTSADLNPDHNNRPSPVVLRVYQLSSKVNFVNADFFSLYDDAQALLAKDLISVEERELLPGAHYKYNLELDPETNYVGIVVAFREIDKAQWISVAQVPEKEWFDLINKPVIEITINKLSALIEFRIP